MAFDINVAQRYATALFGRADKENLLQPLAAEVRAMLPLVRENAGLRRFLESPAVRQQDKRALIEKTFAKSISSELDEFILLLIDKGRIDHLTSALDIFLEMEEEHRGIFPADVTTAEPLDEDQREALRRMLERRTRHALNITFHIDPRVLGGVIFRHLDELLDTSLRSALDGLRSQLAEVRVH
jgi:F-type H+-transporting ATPase subunit delta